MQVRKPESNGGRHWPSNSEVASAVGEGIQDAFWRHRRLGESIVIWRDGRIVELTGDEIPVDEETERRNLARRRGELPPS